MDMQPTKEEIKSLEEKFQSRIHAYNPTQEQLDEAMKSLKDPKGYTVCSEEDIPDYV